MNTAFDETFSIFGFFRPIFRQSLHIFIDGRYKSLKVVLLFFIHSKPELNESLGLSKGRYIILLSLSKTRGKNGT